MELGVEKSKVCFGDRTKGLIVSRVREIKNGQSLEEERGPPGGSRDDKQQSVTGSPVDRSRAPRLCAGVRSSYSDSAGRTCRRPGPQPRRCGRKARLGRRRMGVGVRCAEGF